MAVVILAGLNLIITHPETKLDGYRRNLRGAMIVGDTFNSARVPFQPGDDVQAYVSETDPDSEHHGKECTITDVLQDTLGDETGRELDA
ncbi:hypothetical protein [Haladaptatus sp. DFWS20]|uniref:hypothetical protein n=1 Tax=Haladaptatus sp. DFWS20 TaxID=3403467 RepID=UPI003EB69A02